MRMMAWILAGSMTWMIGSCEQGGIVEDDDDDDDSAAVDDDDTGDDDTVFEPPEWCETALPGELQDVTTTPASAYFVHHPADGAIHVPIVIFLPGGNGARGAGMGNFDGFCSRGDGLQSMRVVFPYAADGNLLDEYDRALDVLDEVLQCYGGDPDHVHLAGTSNGGMGAFELMVESGGPFATLTGAPGVFSGASPDDMAAALDGKAVLNGVGELDTGWVPAVEATHQQLESLGIDSTLEIFPGQGHSPNDSFDQAVLYDFWLAH
jgi:predicted esterase